MFFYFLQYSSLDIPTKKQGTIPLTLFTCSEIICTTTLRWEFSEVLCLSYHLTYYFKTVFKGLHSFAHACKNLGFPQGAKSCKARAEKHGEENYNVSIAFSIKLASILTLFLLAGGELSSAWNDVCSIFSCFYINIKKNKFCI